MGDHVEKAYAAAQDSTEVLRRARWRTLAELQVWFRIAELSIFLSCGFVATAVLPWSAVGLSLGTGIITTVVASMVAFEVLRLSKPGPPALGAPAPRSGAVIADVGVATAAATACLTLQQTPIEAMLSWDLCFAVTAGLSLLLLRTGFAELLRRMLEGGRLAMHVAVFGDGPVAQRTLARLQSANPRLVAVLGRYSDARETAPAQERARGTSRTLLSECRLQIVDAVVLAMEPGEQSELVRMRGLLRRCAQDIYLATELAEDAGPGARPSAVGPAPLLLISERPLKGMRRYSKIAFDYMAASLLLIALTPLIVLIALAIKLDSPGPVFFRQLRVGYNGQLFWIIKFRSMHHHASDRLAKEQTVDGDPRVTRVGRVIRRLSIDEWPQLLNVLRGEMSLVGPRPHAPGTSVDGQRVHHLLDDYDRRHLVWPGITGLAQVRGLRGGLHTTLQASDRLAADLEYIRRVSFWLDLKILILTFLRECRRGRGV